MRRPEPRNVALGDEMLALIRDHGASSAREICDMLGQRVFHVEAHCDGGDHASAYVEVLHCEPTDRYTQVSSHRLRIARHTVRRPMYPGDIASTLHRLDREGLLTRISGGGRSPIRWTAVDDGAQLRDELERLWSIPA